jgi:hypothetical protein
MEPIHRAVAGGDESVEAAGRAVGELVRGTDTRAVARTVEVTLNGALFTWAFYQEGTAARFLRGAVDAVLAPYLAKRRRGRVKRGPGR